jgi:hypothetical protein
MRTRLLTIIGFGALAIACESDPPHAPLAPVVSLEVTGVPTDNVYLLGALRPLTVATLGYDGLPLDGRLVRWSSSRPNFALAADSGVFGLLPGTGSFRVESEGVAVNLPFEVREGVAVPTAGDAAEATLLANRLTLSVPAAVAPPGSVVHARAALTWPADDRLVGGTQVELGPTGTELSAPITVGITFDPSTIPAGERGALRIFALNAVGAWTELPNGSVDLAAFRVSAPVTRLSTLTIVRRSTPTELEKRAGDLQSVPRGDPVPIAPSVTVRDALGRPVSGITVSFAIGDGGGMVTGPSTAVSSLLGVATLPGTWRLGSSAGTYTLVASITGGISTTFTATALP